METRACGVFHSGGLPIQTDRGQARGNSGVYIQRRYEVQILDSYTDDNYATQSTYADGQAGALYGRSKPLVNASRKPGEWQSYDVIWKAPSVGEPPSYATPTLAECCKRPSTSC